MKYLFIALIAFAGILSLQSCGCKNGCGENLTGVVFTSYPLVTGDQWTYQVTDSIGNIIDTAVFTITGISSSNADSTVYKTQTKAGGVVTDSGTILVTGTSSILYRPSGTKSLYEFLKLVFPIQVNGSWQGYYTGDSVHVIAYDFPQTVLGNTYANTYELQRYYNTPGYAVQATVYLVPNTGIVQETLHVYNGPNASVKTINLVKDSLQ